MKLFDELVEDNYLVYASKHYTNTQCTSIDEFNDDLNRIKYIKRLMRRYLENGELQERLILNHIIIFFNVFEIDAARRMLFYKLDEKYWPAIKTFLVYLNFIPEDEKIEVPLDFKIVEKLRKL